jgi:23S rRNA (adenine2503-C2)-methyltransferase
MGKLRSLSSDEILAQVYWGNKACRLNQVYPIDNIVFMGLGEPGDNVEQVVRTAHILVDRQMFQLASRRVTISTVGPTPETFSRLGEAPAVLAWSVHASRDEVRKQLVPTTRYSMEELREGLIQALVGRSKRLRSIMLEVTLLDGINDSEKDAIHLCEFSQVILERVPGVKLVVNLIPWNDIGSVAGLPFELRQPSMKRILHFQRVLINNGIFCYIRATRGDDESAACGQLATKKRLQSTTHRNAT